VLFKTQQKNAIGTHPTNMLHVKRKII